MKIYHPEDHKLPDAFIEKLHRVAIFQLFYEFACEISPLLLAFFVRAECTRKVFLKSFRSWLCQTLAELLYVSTDRLDNSLISKCYCLVK